MPVAGNKSNGLFGFFSVGLLSFASLAAFVYMKTKKKRKRWETQKETSSNKDMITGNASDTTETWIGSDLRHTSTKMDLLHKGHAKGGKLLVVLVGLPGSYKTFVARKVARFLRWNSYSTRAFSIAKYRLDKVGSKSADFFDPNNKGNAKQRKGIVAEALEDALRFLHRGGEIAILDGTNTTRERRNQIRNRLKREDNGRFCEILWIESLCGDDALESEKLNSLKNSPDFISKSDFERRSAFYRMNYAQLGDDEGGFVRISSHFTKFTLFQTQGYLPTKIVSFVVNLKPVKQKSVYLCRHGESLYNARGFLGGDSGLTGRGLKFSAGLAEFLSETQKSVNVWVSTMRRSRETAAAINAKRQVQWRALNDLDVGVCDGYSYEMVKNRFPEEYRSRSEDKLRYRYPRGESYLDLIARLEPVILELERWNNDDGELVIIAHQAVLRCLYAYMTDLNIEEVPFLSIPLHTLIQLQSMTYGCREKRMRILVDKDDELRSEEARSL
jgi:6-phosphofructo-2-kinase / fructose-2,6-biphosphatase 3